MATSTPVIALTRAAADNQLFAAVLAHHGLATVEAPMVKIEVTEDHHQQLRPKIVEMASVDWLVFTSANGVRSFDAVAVDLGVPLTVSAKLQVAVVGPATRDAVEASTLGPLLASSVDDSVDDSGTGPAGVAGHGQLVPSAGRRLYMAPSATAADLIASFPPVVPGGRSNVLAVLGALADDALSEGLTAKGYEVQRVDGYENVRPEVMADLPPVDAVTFFSPSAVARFDERYGSAWSAVCVGPRTAKEASQRGFSVLATANPHTEHGVLQELLLVVKTG